MNWARYARRAMQLPPRVVMRKVATVVARPWRNWRERWIDTNRTTYLPLSEGGADLESCLPHLPVSRLAGQAESILGVGAQFIAHRFDILGSGWVRVHHGMDCAGFEGIRYDARVVPPSDRAGAWLQDEVTSANLAESQRIWRLVGAGYTPIDWQLDVKSGYRWSARVWARDIHFGTVRGADVKIPWELSRLQHLPQLALAYTCIVERVAIANDAEAYVREFRNQVLDFVATNPPRFGVNWVSTMDVGIRVANMLLALDVFRNAGASFDAEFLTVFARSVVEHGSHIVRFLEWNEDLRGNHYLANLAGLLFTAAYLPSSPRNDGWMAFAARELLAETQLQFNSDGSNFEGSTAYHRLSAEIVAYAVALLGGLTRARVLCLAEGRFDPPRIAGPETLSPPEMYHVAGGSETLVPPWMPLKLARMAAFSRDMIKPNGRIVLFGDNDSGRFIKFQPVYRKVSATEVTSHYRNLQHSRLAVADDVYWDEDHHSPAQLIGAISGLTGISDSRSGEWAAPFETELFASLRARGNFPPTRLHTALPQARSDPATPLDQIERGSEDGVSQTNVREWTAWSDADAAGVASLRASLTTRAYPDFGLYVFESDRLFLAIRCGQVGQNGHGGHTHNDQLAIELMVDGKEVLTDPGTYVYSAIPELRNAYRSVAAHNSPWPLDGEPARLTDGLFRLGAAQPAHCMHWSDDAFVGELTADGVTVRRRVAVRDHFISITDYANVSLRNLADTPEVPYAPSYGVVIQR